MKLRKIAILSLAAGLLFFTSACTNQPDAGVLVHEAQSDSAKMKSCSASMENTLIFKADNSQHSYHSTNQLDFHASPFAVKSLQTSQNDSASDKSENYTVTENGQIDFYCKSASGWQKTSPGNMDTSPAAQIEILHLLDNVKDQKYVRDTEIDSQKVHKIELTLKSEVLRPFVENIVTASGIGGDSKTIVQTLLDSAPPVYGYCYINTENGKLVQLEMNAADAVNQIFQNIDGNTVKITVSKCSLSGTLSKIDSAPGVTLPAEAKSASSVQAQG